jgi:hypothetical protein
MAIRRRWPEIHYRPPTGEHPAWQRRDELPDAGVAQRTLASAEVRLDH